MSKGSLSFFLLVRKMRECQKEYFRTRSHDALRQSKMLEQRVDDEITRGSLHLSQQQLQTQPLEL